MQFYGSDPHGSTRVRQLGRISGGMRRACRALPVSVAAGMLFFCAGTSQAGLTERIGGTGGDRTVRMECGAEAFMTGIDASGGASNPLDTSLVRVLSFECTGFGATTSFGPTTAARAGLGHLMNLTHGVARCAAGEVLSTVHLRAGFYIDQIQSVSCVGRNGLPSSPIVVGAGGGGGSPYTLQCPSGEALYRVDAMVGGAIDSLRGHCRLFPLRPAFDEAPAEGALITVSVTNTAEIPLRAHGATGPVTMSLQVPGMWASHFELAPPVLVPGPIDRPPIGTRVPISRPATGAAATSISRVLRVKGPVPVVPVSARVVPVTLALRDGAGLTSSRSFRVTLAR